MEFNEKLQELRKQKGMTQEELAEVLFVSRTAISKWESGRGYPNIESLKALAKFFGVTVDELLSGEELLTIAEADTREKESNVRDLVFGLLDISAVMAFFFPIFGQRAGETVQSVSLLSISGIQPYLKVLYFAAVIVITLCGVSTFGLHSSNCRIWKNNKSKISLILNAFGTLLFIISLQPYAAAYLFVFLTIKALMLMQKQ